MTGETIGSRIQKRRRALGYTQELLAERAGLSSNAISNIERDEKVPTLESMIHIADVLEVRIDSLLGRIDPNEASLRWEAILDGCTPHERGVILEITESYLRSSRRY